MFVEGVKEKFRRRFSTRPFLVWLVIGVALYFAAPLIEGLFFHDDPLEPFRIDTDDHNDLHRILLLSMSILFGLYAELMQSKKQPELEDDINPRIDQEKMPSEVPYRHLVQANKMGSLRLLVSGVAHQINNPNQFIMSHLELLQTMWTDITPILDSYQKRNGDFALVGSTYSVRRGQVKEMFENALRGTKRIEETVSQLKQYVALEADINTEPINLNAVVASALALTGHQLRKTETEVIASYCADLPIFDGIYQQLEQVVINLIQNALEAMPGPGRRIEITTGRDDDGNTIFLTISDNGCGIPESRLETIGTPYVTYKTDDHAGLGLSISAKILSEHNGELSLVSTVDKGTAVTATISLPETGSLADITLRNSLPTQEASREAVSHAR